jgi:hypothetical protein
MLFRYDVVNKLKNKLMVIFLLELVKESDKPESVNMAYFRTGN